MGMVHIIEGVLEVLMIIKILSWNVRGLGNRDRRRMVKEMVQRSKADLVLVQESKLEIVNRMIISEISSFLSTGWVFLPSVRATRGIIIFWNKDTTKEIESRLNRFSTSLIVVCSGETHR